MKITPPTAYRPTQHAKEDIKLHYVKSVVNCAALFDTSVGC